MERDILLEGLNEEQRNCVLHEAPVLQILAGPGSGKTRVLTVRVALMIVERLIPPEQIIVVTFTNKAARELKERLAVLVGEHVTRKLIVGTFHAVALRYLQRYGVAIGLPKRIVVADASESPNVVAKVLKKIKKDGDLDETLSPSTAMSHLSKLKCLAVQPADMRSFLKMRECPIKLAPSMVDALQKVYEAYQDHLVQHNLLDFDDLIIQCIRLLIFMPQAVSRISHVFVDEYQDTSTVQFNLMTLLAQAKQQLTIVGDHDQSIYGFRAADIRNFQRMHQIYNCTEVYLQSNYRSSGSIVFAAAALIEQDPDRPAKQLAARHGIGPQPCLRVLQTAASEADWLATEIRRLLNNTGTLITEQDVAILVRSASLTLPVEQALQRKWIPYKLANARKFLERPHIRILVGYLRVIQDPFAPALLEIMNVPSRKFGAKSIEQLSMHAAQRKLPIWATLKMAYQGRLSLSDRNDASLRMRLSSLVKVVEHARTCVEEDAEYSVVLLLEGLIAGIGYEAYIKECYPEDHADRLADITEFTQTAHILGHVSEEDEGLPALEGYNDEQQSSLDRLLAALSLMSDAGTGNSDQKQTVTISTIHSAKGLEWPVVFIPGVYHGSIPSSRAEDTEQDEERRLLYVAMTRAKALLYLSHPLKSARFESVHLSGFLAAPVMQPFFMDRGPKLTSKLLGELAAILGKMLPAGLIRSSEDDFIDLPSKRHDVQANDDTSRLQRGPAAVPAGAMAGFASASTVLRDAPREQLNVCRPIKVVKPAKTIKAALVQPGIASFFQRPAKKEHPVRIQPKPVPAPVAMTAKRTFEDHLTVELSSSPDRIIYRRANQKVAKQEQPSSRCISQDLPPPYKLEDEDAGAIAGATRLPSSPLRQPCGSHNGVSVMPVKKRLGMVRPRSCLAPRSCHECIVSAVKVQEVEQHSI